MFSNKKIQAVKGEILGVLYKRYPDSFFTSDLAKNVERDEEFVKRLLMELQKKNLVESKAAFEQLSRPRLLWKMTKAAKATYDAKLKGKTGETK